MLVSRITLCNFNSEQSQFDSSASRGRCRYMYSVTLAHWNTKCKLNLVIFSNVKLDGFGTFFFFQFRKFNSNPAILDGEGHQCGMNRNGVRTIDRNRASRLSDMPLLHAKVPRALKLVYRDRKSVV